jgi:hypothetical protein
MANRILAYLQRPCPCCRSLQTVQAKLDRAAIAAETIETLIGDVAEFWIPDASRVLAPKADDDEVGIRLVILDEPRIADLDEPLDVFAIGELRRLAGDMLAAADRLEVSL